MTKRTRVLVVDDEEFIIQMFKDALDVSTVEVFGEPNGFRAMVRLNQEEFDIIFLDIMMPGLNGVQTVSELKQIRPDTPVVMITGYADETLLEQARANGAAECLIKPFGVTTILETLDALTPGWNAEDEEL